MESKPVRELRRGTGQDGYALAYVLLLVTILSVVSALLLRWELGSNTQAIRSVDLVQARYAATDGINAALSLSGNLNPVDTSFTISFADGARAHVKVTQWGLFQNVQSIGYSNHETTVRRALVGCRLTSADEPAFVLGNLQHGLTMAGKSSILGDVLVGPRGVSTGNLKNETQPDQLAVNGRITETTSKRPMVDTSLINSVVSLAKGLLRVSSRRRFEQVAGGEIDTSGYLDLAGLSDSTRIVFSSGNLTLAGMILRRGPPLTLVTLGHLTFLPGLHLRGLVSVYSSDSILIPSSVSISNAIIASCKSIYVLDDAHFSAQLFSPVLICGPGSIAAYPSAYVSTSLSDTSGVSQLVRLSSGARIAGSIMMSVGAGIPYTRALINLTKGSKVSGEVCTNGYLTMDGTVYGLVRAYDLYFYESPTTYLGWLRNGTIDRQKLSNEFLTPYGPAETGRREVLLWL